MGELYNPFPKLPKNIRQIGDSDQMVKFYMEDYVNTYLKRLYPTGKQTMRVGVLLGSVEQYDGTPYIFVDGALEMEDVEVDGEKIIFSESSWKKVYRQMEDSFPKRTIQGWFLCGSPGCQLSPLNYWKQHSQYFAGKNQLMYLNHGLEGDEAIYITSEDGFYRLKGHCIYYERNQMMQDYMITRKDVHRVESGAQETVIRDFRSRLSARKEQAAMQNRAASAMGMLCGVLTIAVLAGGVVLVNNYTKMKQMEGILASVLPAGVESWSEEDFIIEEIKGNVRPTEAESGASGGLMAETMESGESWQSDQPQQSDQSWQSGQPQQSGQSWQNGQAQQNGQTQQNSQLQQNDQTQTSGQAGQNSSVISNESSDGAASQTQPIVGIGKENGQGDTKEPAEPIDYEAAAANGYQIHVVSEGETLYGICWSHYSNLEHLAEICRLNQLTDVDRILAGQKLILP